MKFRAHGLSIGLIAALTTTLAFNAALAQSQVPRTLSYQGTLSTSAAVPVNGNQTIVFSLYNVASGGTALWTETQSVNVANGLFNVTLGSVTPMNLPFNVPYFLGVKIGADAEMTPRSPLASSAYALHARTADLVGPGNSNTFAGEGAGTSNPSASLGDDNTALGYRALANPGSSSHSNTAIGSNALSNGVNHIQNTAVGAYALRFNVSGRNNTALGMQALDLNASGSNNVAIGKYSLINLGNSNLGPVAFSDRNTIVGTDAAQNLFSGKENVALGFAAGSNWTGGDNNVAIVHVGVAGESNTMRLGESGFQNRTFIAGIRGVAPGVAGALPVGIDSNGQLGTTFTIPGSYITGSIAGSVISGPISTTGSVTVVSGTQPKSTMLPAAIGANLGAATSTDRPITIQADTSAGGSEWISFKNSTGATKWHVNNKNAGVNFAETGVADGRLFLAPGGNVGIGTDAPTKATLEVTGSVATSLPANWNLTTSGLTQANMSGFFGGISIYASHLIAAQALVAYSDQRMKRITGRSNAARDLATLSGIEITDYTHIDTANRGGKPHKKVIAQQVEKIYPQAVNQIVDVVPDIYQSATVKDGWIMLSTNLKKGDRVRLIGKAAKGEHEVLEVADGRFRTNFKSDADNVFVYGREVKDFRTVDYEAISMLNVSATQELHRRAEAQAAEIAALKQELQEIRALLGGNKTAAPKKP